MLHGKSVIAVPPGATIREQLEIRGMNQREFAKRMGMTEKHISNLINGKVELSQNVALRLESVLGVPAKFWNNLEAIYREKVARATDENELEEDISIAKEFPYSKMATLGWVPPTRKAEEKVWNLRGFFEVARLGLLEILRIPGIAYRKVGENSKSNYALAAWAQKARLDSRTILTSPVNIDKLSSVLSDIRALTLEDPESFCPKLRQLLGECGIAIVFLPHISGSFLHGATFIEGNHIVIGLTVRGRDADRFWFSLFHELCFDIKTAFQIFFIYGFPSYYRKSSFCISPCFIINHAHFCLPRCLCIRGIHCPSIVGISCYHLPILIIKFYVLTIARWQFLILYFPLKQSCDKIYRL